MAMGMQPYGYPGGMGMQTGMPGGMPGMGGMQPGLPQGPLMPRMNFPPQPMMDSDPRDGPVSVAYNLQPSLQGIRMQRPCPKTNTYFERSHSELLERPRMGPRQASDICGYVQASIDNRPDPAANQAESEMLGVQHNELRLVYACISGWTLMFWRCQEDFLEGLSGGRRAPRALAWWDLKSANDVDVETGPMYGVVFPHRFRIMLGKGNIYFRLELPEDVPVWFVALRSLIQDAQVENIRCRDTELHQRKRWPAACGLARALMNGWPIGERALAIAFHAYDIDYDLKLRSGELMVLIKELVAAMFHEEERAEGAERNTAVMSAEARVPQDELYDRAVRMRRRCSDASQGGVTKDEFILHGHSAMLEAMDMGGGDDENASKGGDVCAVM